MIKLGSRGAPTKDQPMSRHRFEQGFMAFVADAQENEMLARVRLRKR
jgi:hypothetical protein